MIQRGIGPAREKKEKTMNATALKNLLPKLRALGPYVLIELLLPGGTLLALLLWLSQGLTRVGLQPVIFPVEMPAAVARVVEKP